MRNKLYVAFTLNALILLIIFSLSCNKEEYPVDITVKYTVDDKVAPGCEVIIGKNVDKKLEKEKCTLTTDYSGKVTHTFPYPAILAIEVKKAIDPVDTALYGDTCVGNANIRLIKNQTAVKIVYILHM
ncbi:MAG: hypothetical protein PHD97_00505 [Bacteroidales bacterium]|nr:hypothetical protein [Bacteroidales bacterium]